MRDIQHTRRGKRGISYLEHRGHVIVNVQHTSLLGDSQRVLRGDLLPAAHLLNGGVNDDVVQGLIAGSLSA